MEMISTETSSVDRSRRVTPGRAETSAVMLPVRPFAMTRAAAEDTWTMQATCSCRGVAQPRTLTKTDVTGVSCPAQSEQQDQHSHADNHDLAHAFLPSLN